MPDDRLQDDWLSAEEAAARLGVKTATLYAYVSRGVLLRRRSAEGHSRFDPVEVENLARRGRPRRKPGASEVVIESRITSLGADRPYFRGRDALDLATTHRLEEVAELLWTGELPAPGTLPPWMAPAEAVAVARTAQAGLPADTLPIERLQVIVPVLATLDPSRHNPDRDAVTAIGRTLVAAMTESLPDPAPATPLPGAASILQLWPRTDPSEEGQSGGPQLQDRRDVAARLWTRVTTHPPEAGLLGALRTALALLADHELAASTLAARVAASVRADPYAAVLAGIGATGGALHGGASLAVEALLAEVGEPANAGRVLGQRLRRGERVPGFGHAVYRDGDGRATVLLDAVRAAAPDHEALALADAVLAEAGRRRLPVPNIDLALGTLGRVAGMINGAGEAVFAIARTVGWLAHTIEEYENPTKLRLRAKYIG